MTEWDQEELQRIAESDDLHIAPFREDGRTTGTPTWIWSVVVDGRLYVRPYSGAASRWFRSAMTQGAGRIQAAGMTKDVVFTRAGADVLDAVDAAYRIKYAGSPYLAPMVGEGTRSVTVLVAPR